MKSRISSWSLIQKRFASKDSITYRSTISVKQWSTNEAAREKKADLDRSDPCDVGRTLVGEKMLLVVFLVNSVWFVSYVFVSQRFIVEFGTYPKAFMYPKVENDTQNAPKTTIQARVPPSGNFDVGFSCSSRSSSSEPWSVFWLIDACGVDMPRVGCV